MNDPARVLANARGGERIAPLERSTFLSFKSRLVKGAAAAVAAVMATGLMAGAAEAKPSAQTWFIDSCGMPSQSGGGHNKVKVRAWTRPQNRKTVVLLDGLRATNNKSGWEDRTTVGPDLAAKGVNVVQPVGGYMSFYTNWNTPDNFSNQGYRYRWDCVITKSLVGAMDNRGLRGPSGHYAIMGLSMSGSSALMIAANNRRNFDSAGSLSGLPALSVPGMHTAIRAAMLFPALDGGTPAMNADAMWGPPWNVRWYENDPLAQVGRFHGLKLFLSTGSGIPGYTATPQALLNNPMLLIQGAPLELLASSQTHLFDLATTVAGIPHKTYYPVTGLHDWEYWRDAVWNAYHQGFFRA